MIDVLVIAKWYDPVDDPLDILDRRRDGLCDEAILAGDAIAFDDRVDPFDHLDRFCSFPGIGLIRR